MNRTVNTEERKQRLQRHIRDLKHRHPEPVRREMVELLEKRLNRISAEDHGRLH